MEEFKIDDIVTITSDEKNTKLYRVVSMTATLIDATLIEDITCNGKRIAVVIANCCNAYLYTRMS